VVQLTRTRYVVELFECHDMVIPGIWFEADVFRIRSGDGERIFERTLQHASLAALLGMVTAQIFSPERRATIQELTARAAPKRCRT